MLGNEGKRLLSIRAGGVCSILDPGSAERSEKDADLRAERARARARHGAPLATRLTSHEGEKLRTLTGGQRGQLAPVFSLSLLWSVEVKTASDLLILTSCGLHGNEGGEVS